MTSSGEDVYATLLLNDLYLPGALVLAHSLRDAGTTKKLAVILTPEFISTGALEELKKLFDYIIPVERVENKSPVNLQLINRPDLHSTFTKIILWKQLQFRKIVYVDSDVVALRAPDELFDLPHAFSAAPDVGWPDIFNSGLMVLTPNMTDYNTLQSMAREGTSFDGADQGLLNMHFNNKFNRLSFIYNVTPSACYQYLPAYQHFQSEIVMAHFIGQDKPWMQDKSVHDCSSPFGAILKKWWEVYDLHYEISANNSKECKEDGIGPTIDTEENADVELVGTKSRTIMSPFYHNNVIKAENPIRDDENSSECETPRVLNDCGGSIDCGLSSNSEDQNKCESSRDCENPEYLSNSIYYDDPIIPDCQSVGENTSKLDKLRESENLEDLENCNLVEQSTQQSSGTDIEKTEYNQSVTPPRNMKTLQIENYTFWDASKEPPPSYSKPEALSFPIIQYTMSSDPALFEAPDIYPDPPKNMWFEVPKVPPAFEKIKPIFPWEINSPKPSRIFPERDNASQTQCLAGSYETTNSVELLSDNHSTVAVECPNPAQSSNWQTYSLTNAWDDIPEIENYVMDLQKKNMQQDFQSTKLNDILGEACLSTTPTTTRKATHLGEKDLANQLLLIAEDFPSQEEWVLFSVFIREIVFLLYILGPENTGGKPRLSAIKTVSKDNER